MLNKNSDECHDYDAPDPDTPLHSATTAIAGAGPTGLLVVCNFAGLLDLVNYSVFSGFYIIAHNHVKFVEC